MNSENDSREGQNFTCPHCQAENRSTAKFCRRCGRARERFVSPPNRQELFAAEDIVVATPSAVTTSAIAECINCYSNLRINDRFCIWCGEIQPRREYADCKRCSQCQTVLPAAANFCSQCGQDVGIYPRVQLRIPRELFRDEDAEFFPTFDA